MDLKDVQSLIKMVNKGKLSEFQWKNEEFEVYIKTASDQIVQQVVAPVAAPVQAVVADPAPVADTPKASEPASSEAPESNYLEIRSPIVGTFYRSSSPDKPPYLKVGDKVNVGDVVCIVEAMKLFNEIESEVSGTIVKMMVEDASPVEYDQVLFLVEA